MGYGGHTQCSLASFDGEVGTVNKACCDVKDSDDKCVNGVPVNCDYECALTFPPFFKRCSHLVRPALRLRSPLPPPTHTIHHAPPPSAQVSCLSPCTRLRPCLSLSLTLTVTLTITLTLRLTRTLPLTRCRASRSSWMRGSTYSPWRLPDPEPYSYPYPYP